MEGFRGIEHSVGISTFFARLDPILFVDSEATFEFGEQTLRYIDYYGIAYSKGIEQWQPAGSAAVPEPTTLTLWRLGAVAVVGLNWQWHRPRRRDR